MDQSIEYDGRSAPLFKRRHTKRGLRPPAKMPGGKFYLAPIFANRGLVPRTHARLYGYGGMCAEGFCWEETVAEIYNELDPTKFAVFQALQQKPAEVLDILNRTKYDEGEWAGARLALRYYENIPVADWPIERVAAARIVESRFSVNGLGKSFAWSDRKRGGQPEQINSWNTFRAVEFNRVVKRCKNWLLWNTDGAGAVRRAAENAASGAISLLIYLDPTYLDETRVSKGMYGRWEMTPMQHANLLSEAIDAGNRPNVYVAISGYDSGMYREILEVGAGWFRTEIDIASQMGVGETKVRKTEIVWTNFQPSQSNR